MAVQSPGFKLVGVSISGQVPLGRLHLALSPGVTALYGLNGAGKSRVLAALRQAFQGYRPLPSGMGPVLHLRVDDVDAPFGDGFLARLPAAAAGELEEHRYYMFHPEFGRYRRDELGDLGGAEAWEQAAVTGDVPAGTFRELAELLFAAVLDNAETDLEEWRELRSQIANGGYLSLMAVGEATPRWAVWLGATRTGRTTQLDTGYEQQRRSTLHQLASILGGDFPADVPDLLEGAFPSGLGSNSIFLDVAIPTSQGIVLSDAPRPLWVPVEVIAAGQVTVPPLILTDADIAPPDLDEITRAWLLSPVPYPEEKPPDQVVVAVLEDEVEVDPRFAGAATRLSERASDLAQALLVDAPELRFSIGHPDRWLRGEGPHWEALDRPTRSWVDLGSLSKAEARWSTLAVRMAMTSMDANALSVFLQDEPEAALHRRAERHLVTGLRGISQDLGFSIVVATHSPAFLDDTQVVPAHVHRDAHGNASIKRMNLPLRADLEGELAQLTLGITAAELLQLIRVFIVVEGLHDQLVLEALLDTTLEEARARIAPMRGAKNLRSVVNAPLIFDFTDVAVLVVLDNLDHETIDPLWRAAVDHAAADREREALAALKPLEQLKGGEARWLREFGEQAIQSGRMERLRIFGLAEPDIICYLHPGEFLPGAEHWEPLKAEWRASNSRGSWQDLKSWLRSKGGNVSESRVKRAARNLDHMAADFVALDVLIQTLSRARSA